MNEERAKKVHVAARKAIEKRKNDPKRKNRTLSLNSPRFNSLQRLCKREKWAVSAVVDDLIEAFLEQYV